MPTDDDKGALDEEEEPTDPQGPFPPRSGISINLADVASAANEAVRDMQLASGEIDRLEGLARQHRLAELGAHAVGVGGLLVQYGEALKEESRREAAGPKEGK